MRAITRRAAAVALVATLFCLPAGAVGLGPLTHSGVTSSEKKGFYLTLINPYSRRTRFRLYGIAWDDEKPDMRVAIPLSTPILAPKSQRRVLVIATRLAPGEVHTFRVCAERIEAQEEAMIHARICSKLTARRIS